MKVAFVNFWQGFSPDTGLIRHLLDQALGGFTVARPEEADIIMMSAFWRQLPPTHVPLRAIARSSTPR